MIIPFRSPLINFLHNLPSIKHEIFGTKRIYPTNRFWSKTCPIEINKTSFVSFVPHKWAYGHVRLIEMLGTPFVYEGYKANEYEYGGRSADLISDASPISCHLCGNSQTSIHYQIFKSHYKLIIR